MLLKISLWIISFLVFCVFVGVIRKVIIRVKADRIISGEIQATAAEIDRCIVILTPTGLLGLAMKDQYRINKLLGIRDAMTGNTTG